MIGGTASARTVYCYTAPLISRRRLFDVLTLTDEFTANIVLFHLRDRIPSGPATKI